MSLSETGFGILSAITTRVKLRRPLVWATHLAIFISSAVSAFLLRFDFMIPPTEYRHLAIGLTVWLLVKSSVFRWLELDRGWWRFVSIDDLIRIGLGNLASSILGFLIIRSLTGPDFPRSAYLLDLVMCFLGTTGVRIFVRRLREMHLESGREEKQTLIYGAGASGVSLHREIRNNPRLPYAVCGFGDDDPRKTGLLIQGTKVLGLGSELSKIVTKHRVEMILIAVSEASGSEMTQILRRCQDAGITYKIIPGLGE